MTTELKPCPFCGIATAPTDGRAKDLGSERFYSGYCQLKRGLELAADGGALEFS